MMGGENNGLRWKDKIDKKQKKKRRIKIKKWIER